MSKKTYSLSLSRWHTVANRLRAHAEGLVQNAVLVLGSTSAQHELTEAQCAALTKRGEKALADIAEARAAMAAGAHIRAQLADANAKYGVSAKLAEAEGLRQEIKALEGLGQIDLLTKVELGAANTVLAKRVDGNGMMGRMNVQLAIVALDALDVHKRDLLVLERRQQEVMDQVNTLNANKLDIALDEAAAANAGL